MKTTTASAIATAIFVCLLVADFLSLSIRLTAVEPPKMLVVRNLLPSATDNKIDTFSGEGWEQWVYLNSTVPEKGQLVVFIPGTGVKEDGAKAFTALAANNCRVPCFQPGPARTLGGLG